MPTVNVSLPSDSPLLEQAQSAPKKGDFIVEPAPRNRFGSHMYVIKRVGTPGPLPEMLQGLFTAPRWAEDAISAYRASKKEGK